ncbi:GIY-YIG nuclease family protein [Paenibacillus sp. FJAT-26967]|uniref:GIY-YIG nuclease family protein n=1 Tax=Paenibacillus sp. FJAT-26967 TaxID=1729690 RepID=UPI000838EB87|nr:GIY-YIG nuclease family protein [Paenibacillus sp. FJAT-26967]
MFDIYVITNKINGKRYVGYTSIGYKKRLLKHLNESERGSSRYLCKAIRKYGKESFSIEKIDVAESHGEAVKKEIHYIHFYNSFAHAKDGHGYNATLGGEGTNGMNVPKSLRMKMSRVKKEQKAWVGDRNPKYRKGYLIQGEKHPLYGKTHSIESKEKISISNKGRFAGTRNPASNLKECFSLECKTGAIEHFASFFEMRMSFQDRGIKLNRSSILGIMRGDVGYRSYKGFIFYREDVTDPLIYCDIKRKYQMRITEPIELQDHRQGNSHPNAKSVLCFAKEICNGRVLKFDSWYELKHGLEKITGKQITYSSMYKCLVGKYKQTAGYKVFRKGETDDVILTALWDELTQQSEPSTTSRKA